MISEGQYSRQNPPGFKQFKETTNMILNFEREVEETHMKWLEDVLIEAKRCFGKEDHHLLPKTNADKKRKRGRRRKSSLSDDVETSSTSRDSLESKEIKAPAKRHKANERVEELTSQETVDSAFSSENSSDIVVPAPQPEEPISRVEAVVESQIVVAVEPQAVSTVESRTEAEIEQQTESAGQPQTDVAVEASTEAVVEPQIDKSESEPEPDEVKPVEEKKAPTRRTTRRAAVKRDSGGETIRRSTRTRGKKAAQSGSESADEVTTKTSRPAVQNKRAKTSAQQAEEVTKSPSITDPPPRNSPRSEIESYYKNRVKRLINHHENLMSSADEFTPPKRPRVGKEVQKTPQAPGTSTRATRSRITKPIKGGGGKKAVGRAAELKLTVVGARASGSPASLRKTGTPAKTRKDDGSTLFKEPKPVPDKGITQTEKFKTDSIDGNAPSKVTPVPMASDEGTDIKDGEAGQKVRKQDDASGSGDRDDHSSDVKNAVVSSDEDNAIPPSPREGQTQNAVELDISGTSASSEGSSVASGSQQVPRRSTRISQASRGGRRSSIRNPSRSKRRSSAYHRFMTRQSVTRASLAVSQQQLVTSIAEEQREDGRRSTRSRTRKASQESIPEANPDEPASLKRKSQDSDDGAGSQVLTTEEETNEDHLSPVESSSDEKKVTPPRYGVDRATAPHAKSLLNPAYRSKLNSNSANKKNSIGHSSFIKRNTPIKKTAKDRKAEILEKQRREEEVKRKLEDERRQRLEEIKLKREQRARKVAEAKARRMQLQSEKKKKLEERQEQKQALSSKQREDKRKEELEKRLRLTKKKAEQEERRKQEEEARLRKLKEQEELKKRQEDFIQRRKEYEEQERIRKVEEARKLVEQRRLEAEKQKAEVERKRLEQEEAHEREMMQRKEEREREQKDLERKRLLEAEQREREKRDREVAEAERIKAAQRALREKERQEEQRHLNEMMKKERQEAEKQKEKAEQERLKASILKHNTSQNKQPVKSTLNSTITKEKSPVTSYEMTPQRIYVAASEENYGIEDLQSDDSTDDEENPRKAIPKWAEGATLRALCVKQFLYPPNLDELFPPITMPNLEDLFPKKRARFFKRTSSAVWNSPPINIR